MVQAMGASFILPMLIAWIHVSDASERSKLEGPSIKLDKTSALGTVQLSPQLPLPQLPLPQLPLSLQSLSALSALPSAALACSICTTDAATITTIASAAALSSTCTAITAITTWPSATTCDTHFT